MIVDKLETSTFETTVKLLSAGGIVILPCDTIYGICGIAPASEREIRDLKGRDRNKPLLILVSDLSMLGTIACVPSDERLLSFWPGPLTLVVRAKSGDTVAVRIPRDDFLLRVIDQTGPIYSTSVNISGNPPVNRIDEIAELFEKRVDLIVAGGDFSGQIASTVVDSTSDPYKLIRQGACRLPESLFAIDKD